MGGTSFTQTRRIVYDERAQKCSANELFTVRDADTEIWGMGLLHLDNGSPGTGA